MTVRRWGGVAAAAVLLLAACTGPATEPGSTGSSGSTTTSDTTSPTPSTATPSSPVTLEQPAVWPAADAVATSPEAAATAFVENAVGVPARLGAFMAGDSRSGEIEVQFAGEPGATPVVRGTLMLRMLGPDDGWFVIAGVSDGVTISSPAAAATVPAGPLPVTGSARGFEGAVIVDVLRPGESTPLARQVVQGGSMGDLAPFAATLDLSAATPGETLAIVVRGGTGHEEDPGELAAIPVVVGG